MYNFTMAAKSVFVAAVLFCLNTWNSHAWHGVRIQSVPFMVSLQVSSDGDTRHVCGGSIVHDRFVLTAASCFYTSTGQKANLTKILVGTDNLSEGGLVYDIEALFPHPRFMLQTDNYDIGLIKLEKNLTFENTVRKIRLADNTTVSVGDYVEVAGWERDATNWTTLHHATVPVVETKQCRTPPLLGRIITPMMMCAGTRQRDHNKCNDIGGPLFVDEEQVAIASRQRGCGQTLALYTNIQHSRRWLLDTMTHYG